jgi:hypothetical protein
LGVTKKKAVQGMIDRRVCGEVILQLFLNFFKEFGISGLFPWKNVPCTCTPYFTCTIPSEAGLWAPGYLRTSGLERRRNELR